MMYVYTHVFLQGRVTRYAMSLSEVALIRCSIFGEVVFTTALVSYATFSFKLSTTTA